jgi:hypothetical protein
MATRSSERREKITGRTRTEFADLGFPDAVEILACFRRRMATRRAPSRVPTARHGALAALRS